MIMRMNQYKDKWINGINESMNKRKFKSMNTYMNKWMNKWIKGRMIKWMKGIVNKRMNERKEWKINE